MISESLIGSPFDIDLIDSAASNLNEKRYTFFQGKELGNILGVTDEELAEFRNHWSTLTLDRYMGDGGTYRYRRYGQFEAQPGDERKQLPHGPYEQPKYINGLNGGVARIFDPLESSFVSNPLFNRLLDWLTHLYDKCEGQPQHWNIRLHPYRVTANSTEQGNPTPEGLHRDGVDYIVSMLLQRNNVIGGESTITDNDGNVLWQRELRSPLDIMIGKDEQTMHSVSPISPVEPGKQAWRDVLVVAFTRVMS